MTVFHFVRRPSPVLGSDLRRTQKAYLEDQFFSSSINEYDIDWRKPSVVVVVVVIVGGQSMSGANANTSTSTGTASLHELITKHTDFLPQGFIFPTSSSFHLSTYFDQLFLQRIGHFVNSVHSGSNPTTRLDPFMNRG